MKPVVYDYDGGANQKNKKNN